MSITPEEKAAVFEQELALIFDPSVREFTRLCIMSAPDYVFLDCPASSTGKFHPISELGPDGTILHTKKVFTVAYDLCRGLGCEDRRDEILSACIIHDLRKQGLVKSGHTSKAHPKLGADLTAEVQEATQILEEDSFNIIRKSVGYHYGPWSTGEWLKPLSDYTPEELCVYMSDYIASKKTIEVYYKR
ncbi:MAG TPA: HD domain-containing protein [Patescibacteria group bacterium]|nr:HD domain-containing protein [Patescibacteria group bacterium]